MVQFPYWPINGRMGWFFTKFGRVPAIQLLSGNLAERF